MGAQEVYTVVHNMNGINAISTGPLSNDAFYRVKSILGGKLAVREIPVESSNDMLKDPTKTNVDIGHFLQSVTTGQNLTDVTMFHILSDPLTMELSGIITPIHSVVG